MPHGTPDWGQIPDVAGYTLTEDLAELAARLGSICTFDRRGSVFFLDNFSSGVTKWQLSGSDNGEVFDTFNGYAQSGGYCGRITTGDTDGNGAQIARWFPFPQLVKMGFEISFTLHDWQSELRIGFYSPCETKYMRAAIFYDVDYDILYYNNDSGTMKELASGLDLLKADYCFHTLKLVIDLTTKKYVRCILNDVEYDLSDYGYYVGGVLTSQYMFAYQEVITGENGSVVVYVDNAIITRDES